MAAHVTGNPLLAAIVGFSWCAFWYARFHQGDAPAGSPSAAMIVAIIQVLIDFALER